MDRRRPSALTQSFIVAGLFLQSGARDSRICFLKFIWILFVGVSAVVASASAEAGIGFRQGAHNQAAGFQSVANAVYSLPQAAGDLNVVIVGWDGDTASVVSVTDSRGNSYVRAVGPTIYALNASQSIYYAKNIVAASAGQNTVTVVFSDGTYPDVRIAEYSGVDTANPLDVAIGSAKDGGLMNSGTIATTSPGDLLVAGNISCSGYSKPGPGFTLQMITDFGNIFEHSVATSAGNYAASAQQPYGCYYVMQLAAFKAASNGGGSTPLSPPAWVSAGASNGHQYYLWWEATPNPVGITYLIERCAGDGCTNFVQIATTRELIYTDSFLTPSTSYSYRIRVTDGINYSDYTEISTSVTDVPGDEQPPTVPTDLSATVVSNAEVNLNWTASTDNVGAIYYLVERCAGASCTAFEEIGLAYDANLSDSGLGSSTLYRYRVRAFDDAGNLSAYSSVIDATTNAGDVVPPTSPTSLSATPSWTQVNVTWGASIDNIGVAAYVLERCEGPGCSSFVQIASTLNLSFNDAGLMPGTSYTYRVRARDDALNFSSYSDVANTTTQSSGSITYEYTYDLVGRLSHVSASDGSSIDYQYDANGNMTLINRQ